MGEKEQSCLTEAEISQQFPDGTRAVFKVKGVHALNPHSQVSSFNMGAREVK